MKFEKRNFGTKHNLEEEKIARATSPHAQATYDVHVPMLTFPAVATYNVFALVLQCSFFPSCVYVMMTRSGHVFLKENHCSVHVCASIRPYP